MRSMFELLLKEGQVVIRKGTDVNGRSVEDCEMLYARCDGCYGRECRGWRRVPPRRVIYILLSMLHCNA